MKGAIEEVPLDPPYLGYISNLFLVPILNLKRLNAGFLDTPRFKMETVEDVRQAIRPGDWATSIDL